MSKHHAQAIVEILSEELAEKKAEVKSLTLRIEQIKRMIREDREREKYLEEKREALRLGKRIYKRKVRV